MMAGIANRIAGKWRTVETAACDKQHLDLCGPAFIEIDRWVEATWPSAADGPTCATSSASKAKSYYNGDETTFIAAQWARFSAAC